ncbi:MAG: SPOCS domain-containing protein [Lachnospiraceae bacterium]
MELKKENIHRLGGQHSQGGTATTLQLTLDDDFNVPDSKPDAQSMIRESGRIQIKEKKFSAGRLHVRGTLEVEILYLSEDGEQPVCGMQGEIPFDEMIHMEEQDATQPIRLRAELEDVNVTLIHSRKFNVKALVTLMAVCEELFDEVVVTEIEGRGIFARAKDVTFTNLAIQQKDTYRMKEETRLSSSKPNIGEILYRELSIPVPETRVAEGQLIMNGMAELFLVYRTTGMGEPVETYEVSFPFSGQFELPGAREDMIEDISFSVIHENIQAKADEDGEERILEAEAVIELDMKLYEEKELTVLEDIYSIAGNVNLSGEEETMNRLLMKNRSRAKFSGKISLTEAGAMPLQICHGSSSVHLESIKPQEDALLVEGILELKLLLITGSDEKPFAGVKAFAPFSHQLEVKGLHDACTYEVVPSVQSTSFQLFRSEEAEWRVEVDFSTIVFCNEKEYMITDASFTPFTKEEREQQCCMTGYMSEEGDTIWSVGKEFFMSPDEVAEINDLTSEVIPPKTMLLLVKSSIAEEV